MVEVWPKRSSRRSGGAMGCCASAEAAPEKAAEGLPPSPQPQAEPAAPVDNQPAADKETAAAAAKVQAIARGKQERSLPADDVNIFSLFSGADRNRDGGLDAGEVKKAFEKSPALQRKLCSAAGITASGSIETIVEAVMKAADANGDGRLSLVELEALLKGWSADKFDKAGDSSEIGEKNRLAGAAERAEYKRKEGGGFAGLDADEALQVCRALGRPREGGRGRSCARAVRRGRCRARRDRRGTNVVPPTLC